MFKENANSYIAEQVTQMDETDKQQLIRFIEVQAAYKRARKMKGSVKSNDLRMNDIVAIVKKVRTENGRKKK